MTVEEFTTAVMVYCRHQKASVIDWYRTPIHNARSGHSADSPHTFGLGADVVYDSPVLFEHAVLFAEHLELKLVREKNHDHLEPLDWRVPAVRR